MKSLLDEKLTPTLNVIKFSAEPQPSRYRYNHVSRSYFFSASLTENPLCITQLQNSPINTIRHDIGSLHGIHSLFSDYINSLTIDNVSHYINSRIDVCMLF